MIFQVFAQYPVGADAHIGPLESYKSAAFLSVRNPQLFCKLVEAQAEDLGHALLLHGDAVEHVGVPVEDLNFNQPKGMLYPTENPFA